MQRYATAIHIFRRDLRVDDNTALNAALSLTEQVIPVFILDPRQIEEHPYHSAPGLHFMIESLLELDERLRSLGSMLHLLYGRAEDVIRDTIKDHNIEAVFLNRDYSPFSTARDEAIYTVCKDLGVTFSAHHDLLLHDPKSSLKPDGTPYTVFTPFFRKNSKTDPEPVAPLAKGRFGTLRFSCQKDISFLKELSPARPADCQMGGRNAALQILHDTLPKMVHYNTTRDIPAAGGTSRLSPHNKFGTVSIREVYWCAGKSLAPDNRFISELYWRDFFTSIGYFFPSVFREAFQKKFRNIQWDENPQAFAKWCSGETGFPVVDAGMRELNSTGYMHNRVRMIASSFLIKDLHINWQEGERYFARKLVDYDPCVNNGSWQWAASTGCDAQPYFRIFNPWLQQKKFDPEAIYIKRWVPELARCSAAEIHGHETTPCKGYFSPMIQHAVEKEETGRRYLKWAKS